MTLQRHLIYSVVSLSRSGVARVARGGQKTEHRLLRKRGVTVAATIVPLSGCDIKSNNSGVQVFGPCITA